MSISDVMSSLTDRQRLICLLASVGESDKRIASLLEIGVRTVELEKHRVAYSLDIPTKHVVIWAVENRQALASKVKSWDGVSDSIRKRFSESACEYSI